MTLHGTISQRAPQCILPLFGHTDQIVSSDEATLLTLQVGGAATPAMLVSVFMLKYEMVLVSARMFLDFIVLRVFWCVLSATLPAHAFWNSHAAAAGKLKEFDIVHDCQGCALTQP